MNKEIKKIIQELYEIDSSLKEKEGYFEEIIEKMISLKPKIKSDEEFKNELLVKLNKKILDKKMKNYKNYPKINFLKILLYSLSGTLAFGLCFVSLNNLGLIEKVVTPEQKDFLYTPNITSIDSGVVFDKNNTKLQKELEKDKLKDTPKELPKQIKKIEKQKSDNNLIKSETKNTDLKLNDIEKTQDFVFPKEAYDLIFPSENYSSKTSDSNKNNNYSSDIEISLPANGAIGSIMSDKIVTQDVPLNSKVLKTTINSFNENDIFEISNKFLKENNIDLSNYALPYTQTNKEVEKLNIIYKKTDGTNSIINVLFDIPQNKVISFTLQ